MEQTAIKPDPKASAKAAHLRYVTDDRPGITRRRAGKGFTYRGADGAKISDAATLERIASLAIPPAWSEVWICPHPNGHLQATGRDEKGRKQYRYHPRWRAARDETKFSRMIAFGHSLPELRERVDHDLARRGLPREKVLATVVRLLETTFIRVGNAEYARHNDSYGLTTMRDDHVEVEGPAVHFEFRGKSGKEHRVDLKDRRVAAIVKRCRDLPGQDLFQYLDESGQRHTIGSGDVNGYLHEITGQDFTAKDFRTWAGTVLAAATLAAGEPGETEKEATHNVTQAVKAVAERLGNTPAVCRKYYIHPGVLGCYLDRTMAGLLEQTLDDLPDGLDEDEQRAMTLLRWLAAKEEGGLPIRPTRAG